MHISFEDAQFLCSEEGLAQCRLADNVLARYSPDQSMAVVGELRKLIPHLSVARSSALLEIALARLKARAFGAWTREGLLTRQSVEQATAPHIAHHHAQMFRGCLHVVEICTGAGFDTAALASVADAVTSIEADPALALMAEHNLRTQNITNVTILHGKAEDIIPTLDLTAVDGLWCDPSRRNDDGSRIHHPTHYRPALPYSMALSIEGIKGIKISPAVRAEEYDSIHHYIASHGWVRHWTATEHECREQVLWQLPAHLPASDGMIIFHSDSSCMTFSTPHTETSSASKVPLAHLPSFNAQSALYLIEPHPALIRAGYLHTWYQHYGIMFFDQHIAYGWYQYEHRAGELPSRLPDKLPREFPRALHTAFMVEDMFPYHRKKLQAAITQRHWNTRTEIKKRGFPEEPEMLRKQFRFVSPQDSPHFGTIILTRIGSAHWCFLCKRLQENI